VIDGGALVAMMKTYGRNWRGKLLMPSRAFHFADKKPRDPMKPEKERHNLPKVESIKTRLRVKAFDSS
jgi:hypothetical protein